MLRKLVLIDDSVAIQKIVALTFADEDFQIISFSDGATALARLESIGPDIILADALAPNKDGLEICRFVRSTPSLSGVPILLLAGSFEPLSEAQALAAGASGLVTKPFESSLLVARVRELLAGAKQSQAPEAAAHATARAASQNDQQVSRNDEQPAEPPQELLEAAIAWRFDLGPPGNEPGEMVLDLEAAPDLPGSDSSDLTPPLSTAEPEPAARSAQPAEELIDEIVRRVVCRLSDSVIREIAWEVVPELAEKIIRQQLKNPE